jgi:hypothetical protein
LQSETQPQTQNSIAIRDSQHELIARIAARRKHLSLRFERVFRRQKYERVAFRRVEVFGTSGSTSRCSLNRQKTGPFTRIWSSEWLASSKKEGSCVALGLRDEV